MSEPIGLESERIAVVEDDPLLAELIGEVLTSQGYAVQSYASLAEARRLVGGAPNLLVTDVVLPDGSGLDLVAELREVNPDLPVLIVSGLTSERDLLAGFAAGATDYLTKPITLAELRAKCAVLLTRAKRSRSGRLGVQAPSEAEARMAALPGGRDRAFDRYAIRGVCSAASYGEVYVADDLQGGRRVALKVLSPLGSVDELTRRRFVRETYTLSLVDSPNVVRVHDFGSSEGRLYLATEFVEGETVADRVARGGPIDAHEAWRLIFGMVNGLAAIDAAGLIHRDIKPSNVMLRGGRPAEPVLVDFGIAKRPGDRSVTTAGVLVGTPGYVSPEAVQGDPVDGRSDLYAAGLVTLFALAGRDPYSETDSVVGLLARIVEEPVAIPASLEPDLAALLRALTAKEVARRPRSASDLRAKLHARLGAGTRAGCGVRR